MYQSKNVCEPILCSDHFQKLFHQWVVKNCDTQDWLNLSCEKISVTTWYGIASEIGAY